MPHGGLCPWPTFHAWVTMVRKKWLSLYYSTYWCYIHQTCTNYSFCHYLLISRGGLCPWPTFHTWVTMVRKEWLSLYYSNYWCYIYQTYTNCSSWHDLLIPCGCLCPWPTFHTWVTIVRKKWLCLYYSTYWYYSDDSLIRTRLFPVNISGLTSFLDYWIAHLSGRWRISNITYDVVDIASFRWIYVALKGTLYVFGL